MEPQGLTVVDWLTPELSIYGNVDSVMQVGGVYVHAPDVASGECHMSFHRKGAETQRNTKSSVLLILKCRLAFTHLSK